MVGSRYGYSTGIWGLLAHHINGITPRDFAIARASAATMAPGQPLGCLAGFGASLGLAHVVRFGCLIVSAFHSVVR